MSLRKKRLGVPEKISARHTAVIDSYVVGGVLVWWLDQRWSNIDIGVVIAFVILRGSLLIMKDARNELEKTD